MLASNDNIVEFHHHMEIVKKILLANKYEKLS